MSLLTKFLVALVVSSTILVFAAGSVHSIDSSVTPTPYNDDKITENTEEISMTISGLVSGKDYYYCLYGNVKLDCVINSLSLHNKTANDNGEIQFLTLCGDHKNLKEGCDSGDWFGAHTYKVSLTTEQEASDFDSIYTAQFTVGKHIPEFNLEPSNPKPEDILKIKIFGDHRYPASEGKRNKFDFDLYGLEGTADPDDPADLTWGETATKAIQEFKGELETGTYRLTVRYDKESFVLMEYRFTVTKSGGEIHPYYAVGEGSSTEDVVTGWYPFPGIPSVIETPLGTVNTNAAGLTTAILRLAIGIAGGVAFLLLISGAFRLIFSAGNPESIQQGREVITAAIIGLIVVVFSVFLLRLIGISILGLPI